MSPREIKNLAASIRQQLLNLAHERDEVFQLTLTRFGLERLLYRLSRSKQAERFLLKGAMLFSAWSEVPYRSTRDLDLAGSSDAEPDHVHAVFEALCRLEVEPDGLELRPGTIRVEEIREPSEYAGVRVRLDGYLGTARIPLQVDIGFGDVVTPAPSKITYPTLLDLPAPELLAYPPATVVSEKFQAMVALGIANTRMKDFYDVWMLAREIELDPAELADAIHATFNRRGTPLPDDLPIALREEYWDTRHREWNAFLRKNRLPEQISLGEVGRRLIEFIEPALHAARLRAKGR